MDHLLREECFEKLLVWREGGSMAIELYKMLDGCKDFGLRNQMQRSAVSIPSNIAEGYDRGSNKEFIRFLRIARGSCAELRTQCYIAKNASVLDFEDATQLIEKTRSISRKISRLIRARKAFN